MVQAVVQNISTAPATQQQWVRKIQLAPALPPPLPDPRPSRRRPFALAAGAILLLILLVYNQYRPYSNQTEIAAANATSRAANTQAAQSESTLQASKNTVLTQLAFSERVQATEKAADSTSEAKQAQTMKAVRENRTQAAGTERAIATSTQKAMRESRTQAAGTERAKAATAPFINMFPTARPTEINPNSMTWVITDLCSDGLNIWFLFKDSSLKWRWPPNQSWSTRNYGDPVRQAISCNAGTWVCYGAQPGEDSSDYYWGIGLDGNQGCKDCCYLCDGSTVPLDLTCSE